MSAHSADIANAVNGAPPTTVRWRIVALLTTFSFMTYFNRIGMSVVGTDIIKQFHISETQMGWVYSSLLITYTICMTPGGWLSDQRGPRAALMLMGFGSAAFAALTGLAGHPLLGAAMVLPSFMLIRGCLGAFTAPIFPAAARMVYNWIPFQHRAAANAIVIAAAPLGAAVVQPVFLGLVMLLGSWRLAFAIAGVMTAAFTALWAWYSTDHPSGHKGTNENELRIIERGTVVKSEQSRGDTRTRWRALLGNRSLMLLTLSYAAIGYFEYIFFYWMNHYFREIRHLTKEATAGYAAMPFLSMMLLTPIGGRVSDCFADMFGFRMGTRIVPVACMVLSAGLLFVGSRTDSIPWMVIAFSLALGFAGATEGPFWATALHLGGRDSGTAAGVLNTGGNAGGLLAPIITPWVAGLLGNWQYGLALGSIVILLGLSAWFLIEPEDTLDERHIFQ